MIPLPTHLKLRIVHLEDKAQDRELVAETLALEGTDCEITYAQTRAEFETALARGNADLILCDYTLPSYGGTEALQKARQTLPDTPFIFVSGTIGEERAVESLRSGATDYVLKDNLGRLVPALRRALHQAAMQREQRQAETAMRASEHKYRQVFESLGDAAFLIGEEAGKIIDANPQAEALLGRTRGEILGCPEGRIYPPGDGCSPVLRPVARACQTRGGCEALVLRQDGTEVPVQIRASRLEIQGRWFFLALFRDLTDCKLLERQVLRAQRLVSVGTLAGGVAHDLNNILFPILLAGRVLRREVKSPDGQSLLATLLNCARRGTDMVHQLSTLANGMEGKKGPLQPRHLIKEIGKIVSGTFPKAISLNCQVPAELWPVLGVPTQIYQLLLNLAVNARDAMPRGGRLSLSAENVRLEEAAARLMPGAKAGRFVLLRVADTGTGIAPEIAGRIFEPFFSTKGPDKGTGLGLSTVVGIVKNHGGFIQLNTQPNQGTEFRIYLPARPGVAAARSAPAPSEPPQDLDQEVPDHVLCDRQRSSHGQALRRSAV